MKLFEYLFFVLGLDFFDNGATFLSLGVVLPHMVEELSWSWESAGLGFAILGLMTGSCSYVPAWIIRKFGIKVSYRLWYLYCGLSLESFWRSAQSHKKLLRRKERLAA